MQYSQNDREIELFNPTVYPPAFSSQLSRLSPEDVAALQHALNQEKVRQLEYQLARQYRHAQQRRHEQINISVERMAWGIGIATVMGILGLFFLAAMFSLLRPVPPAPPQVNPDCIINCGV